MMDRATLLQDVSVKAFALPEQMDIGAVEFDSRRISSGCLFVALRGSKVDGHSFLGEAYRKGAAAVVVEDLAGIPEGLPYILVQDTRAALPLLARNVYRHPTRRLKLVGVTGTNGKTTVTYLVEKLASSCGISAGVIGTIDAHYGDVVIPLANTTPESAEMQRLLARMADDHVVVAAAEISSHGIALHRVDGLEFAVAIYTNLSQDHLDFHGTMEAYGQVKKQLFTHFLPASNRNLGAVVNLDDALGADIAASVTYPVIGYSLTAGVGQLWAEQLTFGFQGLSFVAVGPFGRLPVSSKLVGRHNAANILAALGAAWLLGFDMAKAAAGLAEMPCVKGRLDQVENNLGFGVWVDYAHSPDSLEKVLLALREVVPGRIFTVFGAGGDRDRKKRPLMGEVVERLSDFLVVSSDNPRSEPPLEVIREIEAGISKETLFRRTLTIADRALAIETAISLARPGDGVLIAGKGHENYQIIGSVTHHFDDSEVAATVLNRLAERHS